MMTMEQFQRDHAGHALELVYEPALSSGHVAYFKRTPRRLLCGTEAFAALSSPVKGGAR
jgi:hypothetical protein